jgi:hypothetical protein
VSPALPAAAPPAEYAPRLRALVSAYARWDRLVKLTVFGQNARSAAFAWLFRGVELRDGAAERIQIAAVGAREQSILVAGGDTVYNTDPLADAPQGFAISLNGALFAEATAAYFVGGGMMNQTGGVATVALTGAAATETEIAGASTGATFKKLVGLVATTSAVFVSDQTDKKIYKIAVPGFAVTTVATVASADLLAIMPNGDLLTGGGTDIQRVTQAGGVTTIMTGFEQVRGLAYDPALRRLFIIDHSATVGTPDKLHVRPLDG